MKGELSCTLTFVVVFFNVREGETSRTIILVGIQASHAYGWTNTISTTNVGFGAAQVDPPSGSVVANFEDTVNAATLTCNLTDGQGNRVLTSWDLGNFRGVSRQPFSINLAPELFLLGGDPVPNFPNFTYGNELTILRLTSELDQVMVFCGLGQSIEAEFTLRIYRKFLCITCSALLLSYLKLVRFVS